MATKQQTASPATQYQDFQPKSEWKEEEEANLLLVYLPGFLREQIGITYVHSSRTIRVVGERPIGNNKWSRFNQAFPVPQNCVVEKIHGRFKNGILSITMPKQTTTKMVPKSEPEMAQKAQIPPKSPEEPKPDKGRPETPTIVEQKQRDEKSTVSSPMAQKGPQDTSPKPTPSSSQKQPDEKLVVPSGTADGTMPAMKQADENKERSIINEKPAGPERAEAVKETHEVKHKKKKIDLKMPGKDLEKRHKDEGEDGGEKHREDPVAAKAKEMTGVAAAAAAAVKRVKGLATATEERQAMVNMGVAVVVIVALGAYISHSFGSSGRTED